MNKATSDTLKSSECRSHATAYLFFVVADSAEKG